MQQPTQQFTSSDSRQVADAVAAAESQTSAEIVAVIAAASGRYTRAEDLVGLWTGIALLGCVWALWTVELPEPDGWDEPGFAWQGVALAASVVIGFFAGAATATRVGWLRRLFVSQTQMREETWARAVRVFYDHRLSRTRGRSGVLIYVSLFERTAAVVADDAVVKALGQPALDAICAQLVANMKRQPVIAALCATITTTGSRLSANFPRASDDVNELGDALILLD